MNFGEKLKQIRTEKNLTQPQFAEAIGIEQSYLSKLENDKSQPSADMFSAIVKSLQLSPGEVLADIDRTVLHTSLRHIPEVSQFLNGEVKRRLHDARQYIWSAAAACLLGFALMLAANDGIFYANNLYKYKSPGVILEGESDQIFEQFIKIGNLKVQAHTLTLEEFMKSQAEFEANRVKVQTIEVWGNRGGVFFEPAAGGRRKFELVDVTNVRPAQNQILQYLGALLMFGGLLLLVVEWRMRKAAGGRHVAA
ncbi:helix-turn-helix domain-containing protein [Pseudoduganella sp. FT25W]|uniref:Helix-turn-helix domain-containing protein n=1 Tax=Duganella alba TaxID=2666081 RepID=A0A6L5QJ10_9BURK|nr:helix-turn-helix domain-containing protein [Duganella alba]MRX09498.1 helix-turn-helix domain-containing protein [Duganella alba]MRX17605.1 helix-turn-helix domain-containing protein [Duganella alba]